MSQTVITLELAPSMAISTSPTVEGVLNQGPPKSSVELRRDNPVTQPIDVAPQFLPHGRSVIVIVALTSINFLSSMSTGLLTVGLPHMAVEVNLPARLLLWYANNPVLVLSPSGVAWILHIYSTGKDNK